MSKEMMCGCVAPDTEIFTTDGKMKQIQDIRIGDTIVGRGGSIFKVMNCWRGPESEPMLEFYVNGKGKPLFVTRTHPIWVQESDGTTKWKSAKDCKTSDKLLVIENEESYREIKFIKKREPCPIVYNLDLMPLGGKLGQTGTMYCNGILTGDMQIQDGQAESESTASFAMGCSVRGKHEGGEDDK